jgi:thioredoxin-related protein
MYDMLHRTIGKILLGAALMLAVSLSAAASRAAELLMFSQGGCPSCLRWEREVGSIYHQTAEAKVLPLRRVDIASQAAANITLSSRVLYTPTFVVADGGREIGRITGYINDDAFWGLLGPLAAGLTRSQTRTDRL